MAPHEKQIIDEAFAALRQTAGIAARRKGLLVEIDTGPQKQLFLAQVKAVDRFETPAQVKAAGMAWQHAPLLIAPYITRETATRCRELHVPFIDTAGNAYLEGPGFLIYVVGNKRKVDLHQEKYRAVTQAGLRVTFALLCQPYLVRDNYRTIAARAGVALGTVGPVLKDLERRGIIGLKGEELRLLDPDRLLQEWVTHYQTTLRPKLRQRRFEGDPERLARAEMQRYKACWGGEMGAEKLTHMLKPATFTIYANEPIGKLIGDNRLRAKPDGNVEIVEIYWNFPPAEALPVDVVPPPLVYADLMATHDGRNVEVARLIYEQYIQPTFRQTNQAA